MNIRDLQAKIGATEDGQFGPASRAAFLEHFANLQANALIEHDFQDAAIRLDCSVDQVKAVRQVEAAGRGFDPRGRPTLLYERHKFHKFTAGRWSPSRFSDSAMGGYTGDADHNGINDSWDKLLAAIGTGSVDAAFMSCSWGAFQVMGEWWDALGYRSAYSLAWACAQSEGDQLELMVRFCQHFGLGDEIANLSSHPDSCRAFALAYNGRLGVKRGYHIKLAAAMAEAGR
jgi:hypothetical protein